MPILDTKSLFEKNDRRELLAYTAVQSIFPQLPPEAVQFELLRQGLLLHEELRLTLDVWGIAERLLEELMHAWDGPDIPVAILPIKKGYTKNGIAYPDGICLYVSSPISLSELHALFVHEYHHICRRRFVTEPPTLLDSLIMEGLAEHAVESLYGEQALNSWTKRYSLAEIVRFWDSHFIPALNVRGLQEHQAFLFGDPTMHLPPWIGYCTGYRLVEAFLEKEGAYNIKQLLAMPALALLEGARWKKE